jgi:hypothetical protein
MDFNQSFALSNIQHLPNSFVRLAKYKLRSTGADELGRLDSSLFTDFESGEN